MREVGWFAIRTGAVFAAAGLILLVLAVHVLRYETDKQKTLLLSLLILLGISALLRALRIPFAYLDHPDQVARRIAKAQTLAASANRPVALLLCRDLMWEDSTA